jgi:hypothetical protein
MKSRLAALALGLAAGCAGPLDPVEPAVRSSAPITNGAVDGGHPYSVALTSNGAVFCSGTLVSPTVVVTAAHCIYPGLGVEPTSIEIFFGTSLGDDGESLAVIDGKYLPDFDVESPQEDEDLAVLRLATKAPTEPIRIGKAPGHGELVTLVGFGITSAGSTDAGVKRAASASVLLLAPRTFEMEIGPGGTCNGDSGGSAIFVEPDGDEAFVGVHTRSDCATIMMEERADAHVKDFIQPFVDADATCEADFGCKQGCATPDPDCACAADGECSDACATPAADPDCTVGTCAADGACNATCAGGDPDCGTDPSDDDGPGLVHADHGPGSCASAAGEGSRGGPAAPLVAMLALGLAAHRFGRARPSRRGRR